MCVGVYVVLYNVFRYLLKEKTNGPEGNIFMYEFAEQSLDAPVNIKMKEYIAQVMYITRISAPSSLKILLF